MRLFLGVICLILCLFVGYVLSQKFSYKKRFYSDFKNFNERLTTEVSFTQKTIFQLINDNDTDFYKFIKNKISDGESVNPRYLKKEELEFLDDYISNVGKSDRYTQMLYLNSVKNQIENCFYKSKEDEKKYKSLYVKMGFLIGLIILVVLL